jgi:hypothetical protein
MKLFSATVLLLYCNILLAQDNCYAVCKKGFDCKCIYSNKKYNYFLLIKDNDTLQVINYFKSTPIKKAIKESKGQFAFCISNLKGITFKQAKRIRRNITNHKIYIGDISVGIW